MKEAINTCDVCGDPIEGQALYLRLQSRERDACATCIGALKRLTTDRDRWAPLKEEHVAFIATENARLADIEREANELRRIAEAIKEAERAEAERVAEENRAAAELARIAEEERIQAIMRAAEEQAAADARARAEAVAAKEAEEKAYRDGVLLRLEEIAAKVEALSK